VLPLENTSLESSSTTGACGRENCDSGPERRNNRLSANAKTPRFGDAMQTVDRVNVIQSNPFIAFTI
jgi:hypothetical protein